MIALWNRICRRVQEWCRRRWWLDVMQAQQRVPQVALESECSTGITPWARDASLYIAILNSHLILQFLGRSIPGLGVLFSAEESSQEGLQLKIVSCQPLQQLGRRTSVLNGNLGDGHSLLYHLYFPLVPSRSYSSVCGNRPLGLVYYLIRKLRKFSGINYSTCFWSWTWSYNWNSSLSPHCLFWFLHPQWALLLVLGDPLVM